MLPHEVIQRVEMLHVIYLKKSEAGFALTRLVTVSNTSL